jgi:ABC-type bacteriocin/lantibiotic exporter with double-glycine peptidase domain
LVLDNVSLDIYKGKFIVFVGKSGSGKTTLSDVIRGLLVPQSGKVTVDGVDIEKAIAGENHIIGFVPQNVNLIDDTVRRNVGTKSWCSH